MKNKSIKFILASFLLLTMLFSSPENTGASSLSPKQEMRASWISTVVNIDLKPGMNEAEYRNWAETTIKELERKNFNAVVFQVKPTADAFYPSELAPWSRYITGQDQGTDPGYDPLQIMLDTAHAYGLELHAWINPYRVTMAAQGLEDLTEDNIATKNPDWVVKHGSQFYLDPGIPGVQDYLIETVKELVTNYDVDAVHMDDYFYPGVDFDDDETFAEYGEAFDDIGDWRRNNVNNLVKNINNSIKGIKPWVQFGISPSGIWRNKADDPNGSDTNGQAHYDALFADSQEWIKAGSIDYITPQVYWSRDLAIASYTVLLDWWSKAVDPYPVNLYIGMADYKVNDNFDEAWDNPRELPEQIMDNRENGGVKGQMHFTLRDILANAIGYADIVEEQIYNQKTLTPSTPWNGATIPNQPSQVMISEGEENIEIVISHEADARKYVIYRASEDEEVNYESSENIIGVVYNKGESTKFVDQEIDPNQTYTYGVTSISRTGIESTEASEIKWPIEQVNKEALAALIEEVQEKNATDYTEVSWQEFSEVRDAAQSILDDDNATQAEVDDMLVSLTAAIEQLEESDKVIETDKTELTALISVAEEKNVADYTEVSWQVFSETLEAAQAVLLDDDASQAEVDDMLVSLATAIEKLEETDKVIETDKTELDVRIKEAEEKEAADYTEASWKAFSKTLSDAHEIFANKDASQEEINKILDALTESIEQLEERPQEIEAVDKSKLELVIKRADKLKEANYTVESWKLFTEVLKNAKDGLDSNDMSQQDIDMLVANLESAIAQLNKVGLDNEKPTTGDSNKGLGVGKTGKGSGVGGPSKGSGAPLPKTATHNYNLLLAGLILLTMGTMLTIRAKKSQLPF